MRVNIVNGEVPIAFPTLRLVVFSLNVEADVEAVVAWQFFCVYVIDVELQNCLVVNYILADGGCVRYAAGQLPRCGHPHTAVQIVTAVDIERVFANERCRIRLAIVKAVGLPLRVCIVVRHRQPELVEHGVASQLAAGSYGRRVVREPLRVNLVNQTHILQCLNHILKFPAVDAGRKVEPLRQLVKDNRRHIQTLLGAEMPVDGHPSVYGDSVGAHLKLVNRLLLPRHIDFE